MTLNPETKKNVKQFAILAFAFLLVLALFTNLSNLIENKSRAVGGGWSSSVATGGSTVNATSFAAAVSAAGLKFEVKNNYYVVAVSSFSPHTVVSSISDTASDTYNLAIRSCRYECTSIWYANYTGTNFAANTLTITFNASTSASIRVELLTGVNSTNIQTVQNNGTATTASVNSFTPNKNYACINVVGLDSGSITGTTWTVPNFFSFQVNSQLGALAFDMNVQTVNNWASYGATTVSSPFTPSSSPQWDDIVTCFSAGPSVPGTTTTTTTNGMSAGIVQEGNSTTVTAISNTLTLKYNPQQNNLLLLEAFKTPASDGVSTVTDNNGLTWTLLKTVLARGGDIDIWGRNFTVSSTTETITVTLFSSGTFMFRVFELTGIATNWNNAAVSQFLSNSGTTTSASLTSFTPPTNWMVLGSLIYNVGDTNSHTWTTTPLTQYNLDLSSMERRMASNNWTLSDYYPQWNLGSTTATITPSSPTSSSWLEVIAELPTQTSGIVTNTLTSTTTTTTTNTTKTSTTTTSTLTSSTTTTTSTTTSTTSLTTSTTTSTNTSFVTSTGTVFPEPAGSLDLWVVTLGLAAQLIFLIVPVLKRSIWFLTFISGIIGLALAQQLALSPTIAYGSTFFTAPQYLYVVVALVAVMSFAFLVWQAITRR